MSDAEVPTGRDFLELIWGHDDALAEASLTEEPGAGKPHAGICAGSVG